MPEVPGRWGSGVSVLDAAGPLAGAGSRAVAASVLEKRPILEAVVEQREGMKVEGGGALCVY